MVLKKTDKEYPDALIPSDDDSNTPLITEDTNRSEYIATVLLDFERNVVPKMLELGMMNDIAKSRTKPYYNDSDQTMMAHILPGLEIMADIVEKSDSLKETEFRKLISLWTIHDLHKLITNEQEDEFEIDSKTVQSWVNKLSLDTFVNDELNITDFHSCVVALHNSNESNIDDSTTEFTALRPHLRLVDAIMSIKSPDDFVEQAEKPIGSVFGKPTEVHVPASHSVDMQDSIIRTLVNQSVKEELEYKGLQSIDIRDNGVLYSRTENNDYGDIHELLENVIDTFLQNLRNAYPIFRNQAFLGGDISSGDSMMGNWYMPTVYDITDLSKLCLSHTEIIQRIVQASVEQQNRPWDITDDSIEQIENINEEFDVKIPQSSFIEGMATLVHTVYREILPELIDKNSEKAYERTLESAIIHVFGVNEETQEIIANSLKNNTIHSSITSWPYKYLIANDLHKRYTMKFSAKERQKILIELISTRLSNFSNWDEYGEENKLKIKRELYLLFATKIKLDGKYLHTYPSVNLGDIMSKRGNTNKCAISDKPTEQNASSPDLLSHRDMEVLNIPFVTENNDGEFENINLDNIVPQKPLSVLSQLSLNIRAQQFSNYDSVGEDNELYVTIHPANSISVASQVRFNRILEYLKQEMFTGNDSSIGLYDVANKYDEIITDALSQPTGVNSIINRNNAFKIGTRMDEASSRLTLPDNDESTLVRGAVCVIIASLMSGVRVCITKNPQLHMNHHKKDDLVIYGPELTMFENVIGENTDVNTLPNQLLILERIIKMSDNTNKPNMTIEQYNNICNSDTQSNIVPGSIVYGRINHLFNDSDVSISAARDAINIDALAAQNNEFAKDILGYSKSLGDSLGNMLPKSDAMLANSVMNIVYDTLYTMTSINSTDEVVDAMLRCVTNISELNLNAEDVLKDGSAYKFATSIAKVYEEIEKSERDFDSVRQQLVNGTIVRSMLYATNK